MASPQHHRSTAEALLAKAQSYGPSAPARIALMTEANVHATLYLADLTAAAHAPAVLHIPEGMELAPEEVAKLADSRLIVTDNPEVKLEAAPKPRTRRKPAAAKTEEAAK